MMKKCCTNCLHLWEDLSVGDRDCKVLDKFNSDEDVEKYFADMEEGCPFFEEGNGTTKVGYRF